MGKPPPETPHVVQDFIHVQADHEGLDRQDGGHRHLVAPADREDKPMALLASGGGDDDVGGRIIGVLVHGVRTVEGARGREAHVAHVEAQKLCGHDDATASRPASPANIRANRISAPSMGSTSSSRH